MYLLTNERYKAYQMGFSFGRLGHGPGVGLRGTVGGLGGQKNFFLEIKPDFVCGYSHEWHMHPHNFLGPCPLGPWEGVKNLIF